jgi:hypothetical protein
MYEAVRQLNPGASYGRSWSQCRGCSREHKDFCVGLVREPDGNLDILSRLRIKPDTWRLFNPQDLRGSQRPGLENRETWGTRC